MLIQPVCHEGFDHGCAHARLPEQPQARADLSMNHSYFSRFAGELKLDLCEVTYLTTKRSFILYTGSS